MPLTIRRRSKFNVGHKPVIDGLRFDSQKEAKRYGDLKLLERSGAISGLEIHPRYDLVINGMLIKIRSERYKNGRVARYTPDFRYYDNKLARVVYEDVKGFDTMESRLRRAVFEAMMGVYVTIT